MKVAHDLTYKESEETDRLVELLASKKLLDEKQRISLYLPKAVVKLLDSLAKDESRSKTVTELVVKEVSEKKKLPVGMFSGAEISDEEIEKIISSWERVVNELV